MRKLILSKKLVLLGVAGVAVVVTGISAATITGKQQVPPTEMAEVSDTTSTAGTAFETLSQAETSQIQIETTAKVAAKTEATTIRRTTTGAATRAETSKRTEAATLTGEKEIPIDVISQSDEGTLHFTKAKIDYEFKQIYFYFSVRAKKETEVRIESINLNTGSKLLRGYNGSLPTPQVQADGSYFADNCYISFLYIPDGSPLTFTYAFEGHAPVTVTINIPGV